MEYFCWVELGIGGSGLVVGLGLGLERGEGGGSLLAGLFVVGVSSKGLGIE